MAPSPAGAMGPILTLAVLVVFLPPRHDLAAALLGAARPAEAETVSWEDLRRNPENGWALRGLAKALRAHGRNEDAAIVESRYKAAWARSELVE